jgi:hypothetical protein
MLESPPAFTVLFVALAETAKTKTHQIVLIVVFMTKRSICTACLCNEGAILWLMS